MNSFMSGAIAIHYQQFGSPDKPNLVLVNSLGTDFRMWHRLVLLLEADFHILCYDKRGHGLSDAPQAPYSMQDHYGDLINLMDFLSIDNAVLCGDSVGGMIAQALATRCPERIVALVLCDTAARIGNEEIWNPRIEAVRANGIEALADATMERWFSLKTQQNKAEIRLWRNMLIRTADQGYIGTSIAIRDEDLTESTRELNLPVLALVGAEDNSTPPDVVRQMSELIKGSRFEVIDDAGHLPCIEQPDKIAGLIKDFLG
ncbi:MAG: 3-oxoadipate enol-lactonase [Gammaproteobacteria bacterium]|jgi:3-oxoadipate enol-lactonase